MGDQTPPKKASTGLGAFTGASTKLLKGINIHAPQTLPNTEEAGTLPNSLCEASVTLTPRADKGRTEGWGMHGGHQERTGTGSPEKGKGTDRTNIDRSQFYSSEEGAGGLREASEGRLETGDRRASSWDLPKATSWDLPKATAPQ